MHSNTFKARFKEANCIAMEIFLSDNYDSYSYWTSVNI